MPTYARQLGFSSVVVGIIYLILPIIGLLAKPIFGIIADRWFSISNVNFPPVIRRFRATSRFQRHKTLFIVFQLLTAIAFLCIQFIPPIDLVAKLDYNCNDGLQDLHYCPAKGNAIDECLLEELTAPNDTTTPNLMTCNVSGYSRKWKLGVFIC